MEIFLPFNSHFGTSEEPDSMYEEARDWEITVAVFLRCLAILFMQLSPVRGKAYGLY